MPVTASTPILPRRRSPRDPSYRRSERAARRSAAPRRIDAPSDTALYTCHCGSAWNGAVLTSVRCPRCGAAQAW